MSSPLADKILYQLTRSEAPTVSGQDLARRLGVTRAAVWKGVETLRHHGYAVESLPGRGYRLGPDSHGVRAGEIGARLKTKRLGRTVRHHTTTTSTNREAERWAREGAPHGALVTADHQTGGRGRMGRVWVDPPGASLLVSLVLRPDVSPATAPTLTYAAAVALADTLAGWVDPEKIEIKWPNDVLLEERKVAGILLEMRAEAHRVEHVIMGVGVNLTGDPGGFPPEFRDTATTVAAHSTSPPPSRLALLCRFLEVLEPLLEEVEAQGPGTLLQRWNDWFRAAGRPVEVHTSRGAVVGRAVGLDAQGALHLQTVQGDTAILAGDLVYATTRSP